MLRPFCKYLAINQCKESVTTAFVQFVLQTTWRVIIKGLYFCANLNTKHRSSLKKQTQCNYKNFSMTLWRSFDTEIMGKCVLWKMPNTNLHRFDDKVEASNYFNQRWTYHTLLKLTSQTLEQIYMQNVCSNYTLSCMSKTTEYSIGMI